MNKLIALPIALTLVFSACGKSDGAGGASSESGIAHAAPPEVPEAVDEPAPGAGEPSELTVAAADPTRKTAPKGTAGKVGLLCDKVAACGCEQAADCPVQAGKIAGDMPDSYWSCVKGLGADDCEAVCAEWNGPTARCFSAAEPTLRKRRNARAAEIGKAPAALVARVKTLCKKDAACGCGDPSCEEVLLQFGAAMPAATLSCLSGLVDTCACDETAAQACFQKHQPELARNLASALPKQICAKQDICGCGWADCGKQLASAANADTVGLLMCWNGLDCQGICSNTQDAGTPAGMCLAQAQQQIQQSGAAASEQQRRHHQAMMGIIGNMGAQRVEHYDANGVYMGTW